MDVVNQALHIVGEWIVLAVGVLSGVFVVIETFFRSLLNQAGVPANVQQVALVLMAVVFIVAALRLFGGLFGWLLTLFFVLLALHVLAPSLGR